MQFSGRGEKYLLEILVVFVVEVPGSAEKEVMIVQPM